MVFQPNSVISGLLGASMTLSLNVTCGRQIGYRIRDCLQLGIRKVDRGLTFQIILRHLKGQR